MQIVAALRLDAPLTALPGIGPGRAAAFAEQVRLHTVADLLRFLPAAYEAPGRPLTAADLENPSATGGARLRVRVRVKSASLWPPRGPRAVLTLRLESLDPPGHRLKAFFFHQPYLKIQFPAGREILFEGRLCDRSGPAFLAPRVIPDSVAQDCEEFTPIYPEIAGVPPQVLRTAVRAALPALCDWSDPAPANLRERCGLTHLGDALRALHAPRDADDLERGRRRFALEEVLRLEAARRASRPGNAPAQRVLAPEIWRRIRARLPFTLNAEQESVLAEWRAILRRGERLECLLHGEVGSGKTAVAFALALAVVADGGQAALLAPTEILARQHLAHFRAWLAGARLTVHGLLGDDTRAARARTLDALGRSGPLLAVGTHALLTKDVRFADLRLVVFDEQHRFGVRQKAALLAKGVAPHVLTMTATPIPRTLAWARYGTLTTCTLRTRAGAGAQITTSVFDAAEWLAHATLLTPRLRAGERAFVVAPRVDGPGGLLDCVAALRAGPWPAIPMEVVHGRMPGAEVDRAVRRFAAGAAAVLCGTTVVEVGLDVPAVEHMLIVGAERLGLASLHQLRGRLARGAAARAGHCRIFTAVAKIERLRLLERCQDGFQVAEADLTERGPGSLRGTRQHGMPGFRRFDPARDGDLVEAVRAEFTVTARVLSD